MRERYGLPYMGSKNSIAMDVINMLPPAETFVDLFAGGCAMTHAAMFSGKYKKIICNDIIPGQSQMFVDAINGKYRDEKRWISRDDFHRLKKTDRYVATCWSFGNDMQSYMFAKEKEPYAKAVWESVVQDNHGALQEYGIETANIAAGETLKQRYFAFRKSAYAYIQRKDADKDIQNFFQQIMRGGVCACIEFDFM